LWVVFEAMGITKTIAKESRVVVASVGRHILKPAHRVMAVLANVKLVLRRVSIGFMSVSCTLNTAPHQQNFTFCMKPLGERRKSFIMVKPLDTVSHALKTV
jgi:hypothetical protein